MKKPNNLFSIALGFAATTVPFTLAAPANAGIIAEYDFLNTRGTTQSVTTLDADFFASDLTLVNINNTASAFSNHFYHNGWEPTINPNKYYELTLGSLTRAYKLDFISFSLEEIFGNASNWAFRTSLDYFSSDLASGSFGGGLVTDFSIDMSSLGVLSSPISFRWYMTADNLAERAGFANHECPGAGCSLSDIGQDLQIHGNVVEAPVSTPESTTILGLLGIAVVGSKLKRRPVHYSSQSARAKS